MIYFISTLLGMVVAGLAVGYIFNVPILGAFVGLASYSLYSSLNISKLNDWLLSGGKPPQSVGPWNHIFEKIYRREKILKKETRELVQALSRIRRSTNRLKMGVVMLDQSLHIQWWNPSAKRLLDLREEIDLGQNLLNLIRSPDFVHYMNNREYSESITIMSPTGNGVLRVSISPIDKRDLVMVIEDITHQAKLDDMRSQFVSNISHEMRSPLTVMKGRLEMCESPDGLSLRSLNAMKQQTDRLLNIVEDLSTISKLETSPVIDDKPTLDLVPMLKEITESATSLSNDNHQISVSLPETATVKGIYTELYSAFSNLIFNAVKYSPDGGCINVQLIESNDKYDFSVSDEGVGIAVELIPRITERFFRVDDVRSSGSGSGLGLSIVKHALGRHDSELQIKSKLGIGSTFSCRLPKAN